MTLTPPLTSAQRSPAHLLNRPSSRLIDLTTLDTPSPRSARQVLAEDIAALQRALSPEAVRRVRDSL